MPSSPARLAANRANAQRSTGPRTAAGKARSAQNALQHGAYAADATLQARPDSPYAATLARYTAIFAPATAMEALYVERAAALDARLQLVRAALDALLALNERRALADCLHEQYNRDRPAAQVQGQPSWSAALRRYDGNPDTYPSDPDPSLDPDLDAATLAYTLTSPRGLALLAHEAALDRRLHAALTALDRLQRQYRETKPTTRPTAPAPAIQNHAQPAQSTPDDISSLERPPTPISATTPVADGEASADGPVRAERTHAPRHANAGNPTGDARRVAGGSHEAYASVLPAYYPYTIARSRADPGRIQDHHTLDPMKRQSQATPPPGPSPQRHTQPPSALSCGGDHKIEMNGR